LIVSVTWPEQVSALEAPLVIADVTIPQGMTPDIAVSAKVYDPKSAVYTTFDLVRQYSNRYISTVPFQLPLDTLAGRWWLVVHVETELAVTGERMLSFETVPIEFHALTETLPSGVTLHVPLDFNEVSAQGDPYAGGRVWRYGNGEIALWWAPGPTQALRLNNAVVMLEATHDPAAPPEAELVEETEWQERTAFRFHEQWPGRQGGPAETWVIQGPSYRLYVLRIRAVGVNDIPGVLQEIATTFAFNGE
jgi:hypothetical protein